MKRLIARKKATAPKRGCGFFNGVPQRIVMFAPPRYFEMKKEMEMALSDAKRILMAVAARAGMGDAASLSKTARASMKVNKAPDIQKVYVFKKLEGDRFKRAEEMGRFETLALATAWIERQPDSNMFFTFEWADRRKEQG